MTVPADITGKSFGRLTAIQRIGLNKHRKAVWLFTCLCGNKHKAIANNVISGTTRSCGCLRKEKLTIHGFAGTRLDSIYRHMFDRCYNPHNNCYLNYGGRGITICEEWLQDKSAFFKWALNNGYSKQLSVDRINNNKGYAPDNCRWATNQVQANNTSRSVLLTINNITKTITEWAAYYKISPNTVRYRIKQGWDPIQALTSTNFDEK